MSNRFPAKGKPNTLVFQYELGEEFAINGFEIDVCYNNKYKIPEVASTWRNNGVIAAQDYQIFKTALRPVQYNVHSLMGIPYDSFRRVVNEVINHDKSFDEAISEKCDVIRKNNEVVQMFMNIPEEDRKLAGIKISFEGRHRGKSCESVLKYNARALQELEIKPRPILLVPKNSDKASTDVRKFIYKDTYRELFINSIKWRISEVIRAVYNVDTSGDLPKYNIDAAIIMATPSRRSNNLCTHTRIERAVKYQNFSNDVVSIVDNNYIYTYSRYKGELEKFIGEKTLEGKTLNIYYFDISNFFGSILTTDLSRELSKFVAIGSEFSGSYSLKIAPNKNVGDLSKAQLASLLNSVVGVNYNKKFAKVQRALEDSLKFKYIDSDNEVKEFKRGLTIESTNQHFLATAYMAILYNKFRCLKTTKQLLSEYSDVDYVFKIFVDDCILVSSSAEFSEKFYKHFTEFLAENNFLIAEQKTNIVHNVTRLTDVVKTLVRLPGVVYDTLMNSFVKYPYSMDRYYENAGALKFCVNDSSETHFKFNSAPISIDSLFKKHNVDTNVDANEYPYLITKVILEEIKEKFDNVFNEFLLGIRDSSYDFLKDANEGFRKLDEDNILRLLENVIILYHDVLNNGGNSRQLFRNCNNLRLPQLAAAASMITDIIDMIGSYCSVNSSYTDRAGNVPVLRVAPPYPSTNKDWHRDHFSPSWLYLDNCNSLGILGMVATLIGLAMNGSSKYFNRRIDNECNIVMEHSDRELFKFVDRVYFMVNREKFIWDEDKSNELIAKLENGIGGTELLDALQYYGIVIPNAAVPFDNFERELTAALSRLVPIIIKKYPGKIKFLSGILKNNITKFNLQNNYANNCDPGIYWWNTANQFLVDAIPEIEGEFTKIIKSSGNISYVKVSRTFIKELYKGYKDRCNTLTPEEAAAMFFIHCLFNTN